MKKFIAATILVVCTFNISAQKLDKVRTVDKEKKELSDEELKKKKKYIINLINLGYNDKTIRLKTSASKNQIKAIRKKIGM
tara:strand:+ start:607 stop:849 length:243 start_codon:yes stop_codon:yes gene_type:complete